MTLQWVLVDAVIELHQQQIEQHGGADGIRDRGALESALARPAQLLAYGNPDLRRLHSALSAIIHSPTATSGYRFSLAYYSYANGCDLGRGDYHQRWFDLAADKGTESELAAWFRERIVRL